MSDVPPSVIEVDFGKERREAGEKLARLLNVLDGERRAIEADPVRFWHLACKEIQRLRDVIAEAQDALRMPFNVTEAPPDWTACRPIETLVVERGDWERLKAAALIIDREAV